MPKNNENIFCNALFQRETLPKTNILKPPSSISKEPVQNRQQIGSRTVDPRTVNPRTVDPMMVDPKKFFY